MAPKSPKRAKSRELLLWEELSAFAATLPEAYEDHPWGELVFKVNKKVFVFLGMGEGAEQGTEARGPAMCVKLAESHESALGVEGAEPAGYGLGRHGWVMLQFAGTGLEAGVLMDWIEESYRLVAPKRLFKALDSPVA